MQVIILKLL